MSRKQDELPRWDPGESTLPRKRLQNLKMAAKVYEQATNLEPPLEPPQPPPMPTEPGLPQPSTGSGWKTFSCAARPDPNRMRLVRVRKRTSAPVTRKDQAETKKKKKKKWSARFVEKIKV